MSDNQDKFNCKHLTCDMDGCYCGINKGTGYNQCVLPYQGKNCEYFEPKDNDIPMKYVRLKQVSDLTYNPNGFVHEMAIAVAESFDNAIMGKVIEIAKDEGFYDVCLINKEFVVTALKNEIERRKGENDER